MGALNDDLGVQASYRFRAIDELGAMPQVSEFAGVEPTYSFRMPPQALQIQRTIRGDVLRDLGQGHTIVTGGEGLGRIVIQGTHGVGQFKSATTPSDGLVSRAALVAFFAAFVATNDERGRKGKPGLRMLWEITGGGFSNPSRESYLVWPETYPTDSRSSARPHAWDWSCTLLLLSPWEGIAMPRDPAKLTSPAKLKDWADRVIGVIDSVKATIKKAKGIVASLQEVKNKVMLIRNAVDSFVAGAQDAIYTVTDLVRGTAQLLNGIKRQLDPANLKDTVGTAILGAVYEVRRFLGATTLTAQQFNRSGVVQSSLTTPRVASIVQPVAAPVVHGDTLQAIAARVLGDSTRWTELVKINGLEFPFLDFSGPGGSVGDAYAGRRVLGASDVLKLPLPATPGVVGIADDPIGTDLPDSPTEANTLVGGIDNLRGALIRRLITPRGRIPWHPRYGSLLPSMVGGPNGLSDAEDARAEALQTLKADPRVLAVTKVTVSVAGPATVLDAEVMTPLGPVTLAGALS